MYNVQCMKRTQIYLPEEMIMELKLVAQGLGTSMSDLIRKAVKKNLKALSSHSQGFDAIIGLVNDQSLPTDISQNIDEYLFGPKAKKTNQ